MNTRQQLRSALAALGVAACGGDGAGPSASFEHVSGFYTGIVTGVSQGVVLEGVAGVTISQDGATLTGTWVNEGLLRSGGQVLPLYGTGPISGTVAAGSNPSVTLRARSTVCPNREGTLTGRYDSGTGQLTVSGPVEIISAETCTVLLSFQVTIVLSR